MSKNKSNLKFIELDLNNTDEDIIYILKEKITCINVIWPYFNQSQIINT